MAVGEPEAYLPTPMMATTADRGRPTVAARAETYVRRMRILSRAVLLGSAVFVPVYIAIRLTGGSAQGLQELPDLLGRLKAPIVWQVPEDGVRYERFYHASPDEASKFVLVRVQMEARMKIGYPIVPKCFQLVDDTGTRHYPLSRSPMFIHRGVPFHLDRDDTLDEELLFEIPDGAIADRLTFERYQE